MPPRTHNSAGSRSNTKSALVERTSVMRHPLLMLHLLGLRLTDSFGRPWTPRPRILSGGRSPSSRWPGPRR